MVKTGDKLRILGEVTLDYSYDQNQQQQKIEKKMIKCTLERNKRINTATKKGQNSSNYANGTEDASEVVYFFEETKGKFSPIARLENISGVHRLEDLVKKFRFPITVQLVYGKLVVIILKANHN